MARRSFQLPDGLDRRVVERTTPSMGGRASSYSAFLRDSIKTRVTIEEKGENHAEELPSGWWEDAIEEYLDRQRGRTVEPQEAD